MSIDTKKLVKALKDKRETEGLSLRKLSAQIGVSFSTLARIERGDGEPDHNSILRILDWLGTDANQAGLRLENVALVHFRAAKNVASRTTRCLLEAAHVLRSQYLEERRGGRLDSSGQEDSVPALALSKPEMEEMAASLRTDLGLETDEPMKALGLRIEGVEVYTLQDVPSLPEQCRNHLGGAGSDEWSAMSVPLSQREDRWAILRNDGHTIERQRVTYLEECWHILLGHKLTKIAKVGSSYGRTYESAEEHDAFYLASATLLPENAVKAAVAEGKTSAEIGAFFGTSPELVEYRIKRLGLWRVYKGMQIEFYDD